MVIALAACNESALQVHVETAPDFAASATVSVFGVFRDGRMDEHAWHTLAPKVSSALGKETCDVGWGQGLRDTSPELARAVESSARENGITDELLERVAPSARGDLVMVLMTYSHIPTPHEAGAPTAAAPLQPMGRGRGGQGGGGRPAYMGPTDERVFELSASLYSVKAHHQVAEITLRYGGADLDEAMKGFAESLRKLVPGATCAPWKFEQDTDAGRQTREPDTDGGA